VKIILLEVSHWHAPLYYDALEEIGATVVGVSDRDGPTAERVARRFGAQASTAWREVLTREQPDFAFVFGRHREMPAIGEALIERGIPFVIEKPCGLTAQAVRGLLEQSQERRLFVAVPLVQSLGPLAPLLEECALHPGPRHLWFRFIAGPPSRYPASGSGWMLDPAESGGGCFINLSGHFIELALRLLPRVTRVWARMSNAVYGERIEDYAHVALEGSDGSTATVETGYLFPSGTGRPREVYFSSFGRHGCRVWWGERTGSAVQGQPWQESPVNLDSDPLYHQFVLATLKAFRQGAPPPVGLDAMVRVMEVIDAAYQSAKMGQPVSVGITGIGGKVA